MEYTTEDIKDAYIKLKSYVYFDNTDLILRRKLVEFESNTYKKRFFYQSLYGKKSAKANQKTFYDLNEKLEVITKELNSYHENSDFFRSLSGEIKIDFYPKKFKDEKRERNFITNERIKNKYKVERVTPFINAPIELHIISVLWIIKYGFLLDKELRPECLGNRLLLNQDKSGIVKGSGLFKPYFNQYQKWRDEAVLAAENILKKDKNVAFLHLDVKDYFSSVRIDRSEINSNNDLIQPKSNLKNVFLSIHDIYTNLLVKEFNIASPGNTEKGNSKKVLLPIGLISSYVLANHYLQRFDERILSKVKPAYYGRYVDDMLFVIADPEFEEKEADNDINFDTTEYNNLSPTLLERFVLKTFPRIIKLTKGPPKMSDNKEDGSTNLFYLQDFDLYCQSEKSLLHFFDSQESHLVIDRLKQELDEKTSEFRDFPEDHENNLSFTSSAYHLHYDGSEGKIRTLKDYKENRFGLTIFLSNKIFSTLRHENQLSDEESQQIISFFKGENCLTFYRLWERILTLLLINHKAKDYVGFYFHCLSQINNIRPNHINSAIGKEIEGALREYLDAAHEITLSLNLNFLQKAKDAARNFDYTANVIESHFNQIIFEGSELTRPDSLWINRYRLSNMMRHHYVVHPLLTFTQNCKNGRLKDLTSIYIDFKHYEIDEDLAVNSPPENKILGVLHVNSL